MALNFLYKKLRTPKITQYQYVTVNNWIFYFGGIVVAIMPSGLIGCIVDKNIVMTVIFATAVLFGIYLMVAQKLWKITYDEYNLIFRNSFGMSHKYQTSEINILNKGRTAVLRNNEKKITSWDFMLINIDEDIALMRFLYFNFEKPLKKVKRKSRKQDNKDK